MFSSNTISAAENIVIDMQDDQWRLLQNDDSGGQHELLTISGSSLRYSSRFGATRRLPTSGMLDVAYVQQVVLGWSVDDQSWHLGLLLGPDLATVRGSRWCELAHWPDPDHDTFDDLARDAGQSLAGMLRVPFYRVPPREIEIPQPAPLPALPLQFGMWAMSPLDSSGRLAIRRDKRWVRIRYTRILWYAFWVLVYVVISVASLVSDLALPNAGTLLPNPQLLPYLGLVVAVVLVGLIIQQILQLRSKPDTIVIDPTQQVITGWRGKKLRWQYIGQDVQSIYVTEVVKKRDTKPVVYHGELNMHLGGGYFHFILQLDQQEDNPGARRPDEMHPQQDEVMPLTTDNVNTDLQAAGLHLAEALGGLSCWYDVRAK